VTSEAHVNEEFEDLLDYLKRSRGFDFTAYKRASLMRRVEKRMHTAGIDRFATYGDYLEAHPQEFTQLFNTILINVTSFFRDPPMWEYIAGEVIPQILASRPGDSSIRVWSAGCSSGEEAFSLAMLLADALGAPAFRERVKIYATDVDDEALTQARMAAYSEAAVSQVPAKLAQEYFDRTNGQYVFNRELRRSIIFGRHDLILDPPISRVALLVCRNTLMYFNAEVQQRILDRFHFGLHSGGFLFLGKAEMLLARSTAFTPVDLKKRIFVKSSRPQVRNGVAMAALRNDDPEDAADARLRDLALQADPTPQIVVDGGRVVVLANERAKLLFRVAPEDIGRPLQDLEVSYRPVELRSLIEKAWADRKPSLAKDIEWTLGTGERAYFDVQVIPLFDSSPDPLGAKVLFRDVTRYRRLEDDLKQSHQELETANEELQSTNEELETTNEELQSTVEELETTNEELQSTNEELETMNEELQSTNEELQTSNEQLRQSGDELTRANDFLENILRSFHEGLFVVDGELRVQAWNSKAEDLWGVRSTEAQGKHLMNLDIGLPTDQLRQPLRACLSGESKLEKLTLPATNRRGRAIEVDVTCTPFAVGDDPTWGALVMMEDRAQPSRSPAST
jgi:two-component system, chemotaxis family, CheB/CheR fusion protein